MAISQINSNSLASGVPASSNMPAGSVLQVVQGLYSTGTSTTSGTAVSTGLTVSITPKFASSKILVSVSVNGVQKQTGNVSNGVILYVYRNSSSLLIKFGDYVGYTATNVTNNVGSCSVDYLDSPATTSSTTYTLYFASNIAGNQAYMNAGGENSTITVMEIAA